MKIVDFKSFKDAINRLDRLAQQDPSKIKIDFPKATSNDVKKRMEEFFKIADGKNPEWNV